MGRGWYINGPTMVAVKGRSDIAINVLTQLGLAESPIQVSFELHHKDINLDAFGSEVPPEVQAKIAAVNISMDLINFDQAVADVCLMESMGGSAAVGVLPPAGALLGNSVPRFSPANTVAANNVVTTGNHLIGLNLSSPNFGKPYRFIFSYLTQTPYTIPLGTEKSVLRLNWRCIPYIIDPWNAGLGASGVQLWDNSQDT
jgi:hypothetical protein